MAASFGGSNRRVSAPTENPTLAMVVGCHDRIRDGGGRLGISVRDGLRRTFRRLRRGINGGGSAFYRCSRRRKAPPGCIRGRSGRFDHLGSRRSSAIPADRRLRPMERPSAGAHPGLGGGTFRAVSRSRRLSRRSPRIPRTGCAGPALRPGTPVTHVTADEHPACPGGVTLQ